MSLSRILNDQAGSASSPPSDHTPIDVPADTHTAAASQGVFQSTGGWNSETGRWIPGELVPVKPTKYYSNESESPQPKASRKRRKIDQAEVVERRTSSRLAPKLRASAAANASAPVSVPSPPPQKPAPPPPPPPPPEPLPPPVQEDSRLASSDLDDCEDVWKSELGKYVLETRIRARQVEKWFEDKCRERNDETTRRISQSYAKRLGVIHARIRTRAIDEELLSTLRQPSPYEEEDVSEMWGDDNEDAARELEESMLGQDPRKRRRIVGDLISDPEGGRRSVSKKFKLDEDDDITDHLERSLTRGRGGRGKKPDASENGTPDPEFLKARRRPPQRKKDGMLPFHVNDDADSSGPGTPAPNFFSLGEVVPPLQRALKVDSLGMVKRMQALEDAQRKVWLNIVRKDIPKAYKFQSTGYQVKMAHHKRLAGMASNQARKSTARTAKTAKDAQVKAKRVMREVLMFWKKNDKEEREGRKKADREAIERAKIEDEKRENARQARKLEFLITQTELYSHFVGSKLKTSELENTAETAGTSTAANDPAAADPAQTAAAIVNMEAKELVELDFNNEDRTNLHLHARKNAEEAVALARQRAQEFDAQAKLTRKTNEALKLASGQGRSPDEDVPMTGLTDLDSDELNFQNPTSMGDQMSVGQPKMLMAQLKEYQLKGLNWLATLYEQGINGILADEMGLGKTVQSISLLAYLAETHDIWGPFLVIAPASTLHNWQQELTRFVPGLKTLPYWGDVNDRKLLRKFWGQKKISYNKDAPFHVLVTSYQLVVADEKYFQSVKWQYMILDEAQAIKSSESARWKVLLTLNCRNRLLLTGTPIQNSMRELWALLHFIMPSLFDSHEEFSKWFSKDIENAAEKGGSRLNEHQLRRLHMILKPFMLRRVKRNVQNELGEKIEHDVFCELSPRQRALYQGLRANLSVADLLERAANLNDAATLMNLVVQFRKVCNHPELFERAQVTAPFAFCKFGQSGNILREGNVLQLPYSSRNSINYSIPELFYREGGLLSLPGENERSGLDTYWLAKMMNIWRTDWLEQSTRESNSAFSILPLLDKSSSEAHSFYASPLTRRLLLASREKLRFRSEETIYFDQDFIASYNTPFGLIQSNRISRYLATADTLPALHAIASDAWATSFLSRRDIRWPTQRAAAPPITMQCIDRSFVDWQSNVLECPLETLALYGLPPATREYPPACTALEQRIEGIPPTGLIENSASYQLPTPQLHIPEAKRLIYDSGKLAKLDSLLTELKAGDHRVLIYFQMTRMMDLMEEYMVYRQYKYLRLDGNSKIEDRRDMVMDWQTQPDIFVFLLSTRAGGLGINLTAADTVIFYDHDWNPSNDAQAMDRAHRLGQTRQVTVYRLITKNTIDERIVQLARVKKDVQDIVVGNKQFTEATKPTEIVSLLLNDDELANLKDQPAAAALDDTEAAKKGKGKARFPETLSGVGGSWNADEGDDFFGHTSTAGNNQVGEDDEGTPVPRGEKPKRGRKKKSLGDGPGRGRKSTGPGDVPVKRGRKPKAASAEMAME